MGDRTTDLPYFLPICTQKQQVGEVWDRAQGTGIGRPFPCPLPWEGHRWRRPWVGMVSTAGGDGWEGERKAGGGV